MYCVVCTTTVTHSFSPSVCMCSGIRDHHTKGVCCVVCVIRKRKKVANFVSRRPVCVSWVFSEDFLIVERLQQLTGTECRQARTWRGNVILKTDGERENREGVAFLFSFGRKRRRTGRISDPVIHFLSSGSTCNGMDAPFGPSLMCVLETQNYGSQGNCMVREGEK